VKNNGRKYEIISPKVKGMESENSIFPVYSQTSGITSNKIANFVRAALDMLPEHVAETLPQWILDKYNLCSYDFALKNIHFPKNKDDLRAARNRLVFDEFFIYQLGLGFIKKRSRITTDIKIKEDCTGEFYKFLPFELTNAQKRSINECVQDIILGKYAMNRLLQGDVGSGKTAVAAAVSYLVAKNGYQVAVMAPTEILASQHYNTFCKFFKDTGLKICLACGSLRSKEKRRIQQEIELGFYDIIIGTHALISEKTIFKNLGLVVTDEQHRFGVNQRSVLVNKGISPHTLVMSATPIPRTLALIVYGDLDISVLDETLPGRQKIDTFRIDENKRLRALNFIKGIVDEGGQAYIVCAGIEENENDIIDVETYYDKMLSEIFEEKDVGILHGKMSANEKDEVMRRFIEGELKVLIATTVIEVGVDVGNARVIMIENAERFGISQLHQLRGRVGRSDKKSYCILVSDSKSRDSNQRFNAMTSSNDGFYLSEEDLKLRGPGDFFGTNQHGVPNIAIPTRYEDVYLVKQAQNAAVEFFGSGVDLNLPEFKFIKSKLVKSFELGGANSGKGVIF
ncbi:MAG: ATP-dependent DNA helicase RecG, partial [Clostridia bacterium]|nr:ATP-dependent DNA helicase RecG [Clostridia bacterium]